MEFPRTPPGVRFVLPLQVLVLRVEGVGLRVEGSDLRVEGSGILLAND